MVAAAYFTSLGAPDREGSSGASEDFPCLSLAAPSHLLGLAFCTKMAGPAHTQLYAKRRDCLNSPVHCTPCQDTDHTKLARAIELRIM